MSEKKFWFSFVVLLMDSGTVSCGWFWIGFPLCDDWLVYEFRTYNKDVFSVLVEPFRYDFVEYENFSRNLWTS